MPVELAPGGAHPYGLVDRAGLAELLSVEERVVDGWVAAGLPVTGDSGSWQVDSFAACNWVSWHALDSAPVLQRRWQWYLRWFDPARDWPGGECLWLRRRQAFLPRPVEAWSWAVPDPIQSPGQLVLDSQPWKDVDERVGRHGRICSGLMTSTIALQSRCTLRLRPAPALPESSMQVQLREDLRAFVADFHYGYRHHQHADSWSASGGSCLDAALAFARQQTAIEWTLVAGLVPEDRICNPHYWLVCESEVGELMVDPSLVAIATMLGRDLVPWLERAVGSDDGRRICLARTVLPAAADAGGWQSMGSLDGLVSGEEVPGFISPSPGELYVRIGGQWYDAWACQDWVCGLARDSFSWSLG